MSIEGIDPLPTNQPDPKDVQAFVQILLLKNGQVVFNLPNQAFVTYGLCQMACDEMQRRLNAAEADRKIEVVSPITGLRDA